MTSKKIKIYTNCIAVKGSKNAIICDLQRHTFENISVDLYNFINNYDSIDIVTITKIEGKKKAKKYIKFLIDHDFAFLTSNPKNFPKLDVSFNYPFEVSNASITVNKNTPIDKVLNELENLNCKFLEFIVEENVLEIISYINNYIEKEQMILSSIGFVIKYEKGVTKEKLSILLKKFPRLIYIITMNYIENDFIPPIRPNNTGYLIFSNTLFFSEKSCGVVCSGYFASNIKLFTEAIKHNSCLHKKISIDKDGNIKNCSAMSQSFGNIYTTTLEQALNQKDFKKYWNLTKDNIEVCKDCEFRYICTDCRAYTEQNHMNEDGLDISKPLKCGYNPYSGEWKEWSTNPLKQKAIQSYGLHELM
ncbi:hypothetical protein GCM10023210_28850 [Chryseobacterium ginsengisoli]|uniref:4Fe4S-binding SPASM domain-containing protein n=1 Tax=Chryseobacterium ginsengisoli TaxID=363853 RepID=A0ABP9MIZ3_9FLAO